MKKRPAAAVCLALFLAGCSRHGSQTGSTKVETSTTTTASTVPATTEAPLTYKQTTPAAEVEVSVPAEVAAIPALYALTFTADVKTAQEFAKSAVGDEADLVKDGASVHAYSQTTDYKTGVQTPRLLGLVEETMEDTAGAHPNHATIGLMWDRTTGKLVAAADLLNSEAARTALDAALCDAARAVKTERTGEAPTDDPNFSCPTWKDAKATLAPSNVKGKAGGLDFLYSPYEIGAYAEGDYRVTLPVSVFQGALLPAYAGEFAGTPPKRGSEP